jgi:hypothetical protein
MTQAPSHTKILASTAIEVEGTLAEEHVHNDYKVGPDLADLLGLGDDASVSATTKTIKMRDRDILATDNTVLASLSGMSTTVTQMTDPHDGAQWLFIAFKYLVTARGWHTDPSITHGLYFLNRDSGPIFSWGFPYQDFTVQCGWNNHLGYYLIRDHDYVSWFRDWHRVSWRLSEGLFYPC